MQEVDVEDLVVVVDVGVGPRSYCETIITMRSVLRCIARGVAITYGLVDASAGIDDVWHAAEVCLRRRRRCSPMLCPPGDVGLVEDDLGVRPLFLDRLQPAFRVSV